MNMTKLKPIGLLALSLAFSGCGKKDDAADPTEQETTTTTSGVSSTGGTGGGKTTIGTLSVSSGLNALPDLETMFSVAVDGLSLAASGTPPKVYALAADVETNLTGDIDDIAAAVQTAAAARDWPAVRAEIDDFHAAQAKCRVMQDTARQVQDLSDLTVSTCRMKKVTAKGAGGLKIVSGTDPGDGQYFAAGAADVVRAIELNKDAPAAAVQKIVLRIAAKSATADIYKVKLTTCTGLNKAAFAELITVDGATSTLTYEVAGKNQVLVDGATKTSIRHGLVTGQLASAGDDATTMFDDSAVRTLKLSSSNTLGTVVSQGFNARVEIADGGLSTTFFGQNTNGDAVGSHKVVAKTKFTGEKAASVAVTEGAGRDVSSFKTGALAEQTVEHSIGFEYQESATPRYATVTTSSLIDAVAAVDFATDVTLKETAPVAPDMTLLSDADCDSSAATSVAVVSLNVPALLEMAKDCETKFVKMDEICKAVDAKQQDIFTALAADKAANPSPH